MTPTHAQISDVLGRFGAKQASFASILPAVAGPVLGGFAGRTLGPRFMKSSPVAGELLGTIAGMSAGKYLGDEVVPSMMGQQQGRPSVPPDAPYSIDPTAAAEDIPPWALLGAQYMQPQMKFSHDESATDLLIGEMPGASVYEGAKRNGWRGALGGTLGQIGGAAAGFAPGLLAGKGIQAMVGHDPRIPLINMPLSHLLAGLGATIGASKGFNFGVGK